MGRLDTKTLMGFSYIWFRLVAVLLVISTVFWDGEMRSFGNALTIMLLMTTFNALAEDETFSIILADAEMTSLSEWFSLPKDQQEPSYPFVRCAGMYLGISNYVGTAALGKEVTESYQLAIGHLSLAAANARLDHRGGELLHYLEQVANDRELISQVYEERMLRNYAATGQAAVDDPIITEDMTACKAITERLAK